MSVTEISEEVAKLSPTERRAVLASLSADESGFDAKREQHLRNLLEEGLITKIPPRRASRRVSRPVAIDGKPLSETIIEERR